MRSRPFIFAVFLLLALWTAACGGGPAFLGQAAPTAATTPTAVAAAAAAATPTPLLGEYVMTRIPEPTATPGAVAREVEKMAARAGLARTRVLGLTIAEWTSLTTSLLAVLFAYLLGTLLILNGAQRSEESPLCSEEMLRCAQHDESASANLLFFRVSGAHAQRLCSEQITIRLSPPDCRFHRRGGLLSLCCLLLPPRLCLRFDRVWSDWFRRFPALGFPA